MVVTRVAKGWIISDMIKTTVSSALIIGILSLSIHGMDIPVMVKITMIQWIYLFLLTSGLTMVSTYLGYTTTYFAFTLIWMIVYLFFNLMMGLPYKYEPVVIMSAVIMDIVILIMIVKPQWINQFIPWGVWIIVQIIIGYCLHLMFGEVIMNHSDRMDDFMIMKTTFFMIPKLMMIVAIIIKLRPIVACYPYFLIHQANIHHLLMMALAYSGGITLLMVLPLVIFQPLLIESIHYMVITLVFNGGISLILMIGSMISIIPFLCIGFTMVLHYLTTLSAWPLLVSFCFNTSIQWMDVLIGVLVLIFIYWISYWLLKKKVVITI